MPWYGADPMLATMEASNPRSHTRRVQPQLVHFLPRLLHALVRVLQGTPSMTSVQCNVLCMSNVGCSIPGCSLTAL